MKNQDSFYLYLQKRLLESTDEENIIEYKQAEKILLNIRISKPLVPILMRELNHLELIKRINRNKIEIINPDKSKKIIIDWKYGKRQVKC